MIVDEIAKKIWEMKREFFVNSETCPEKDPVFVVYMGEKVYYECMKEVSNSTSVYRFDLIENIREPKIAGQRVCQVTDDNHPWRVFQL